jgi:hypothetical protein
MIGGFMLNKIIAKGNQKTLISAVYEKIHDDLRVGSKDRLRLARKKVCQLIEMEQGESSSNSQLLKKIDNKATC